MKTLNRLVTSLFLIGVTVLYIQAQSPYKLRTSKMSVMGTSSLHEWESDVTQVDWSGLILIENKKISQVKDVVVKIPVTSIKSAHGSMMDNKTYEAFNSEKNPTITYKLSSMKILNEGDDFSLNVIGTLSMAGATKPLDLQLKAKVLSNGDVQLIGSKKINMKDFGMEPPTAVLGTIKVGQDVTIKFDLIITLKDKQS